MLHYQTAHKSIVLYGKSDLDMRKIKIFVDSLAKKKLKTASGIYENLTETLIIKKDKFRVLRSLKLGQNGFKVLVF